MVDRRFITAEQLDQALERRKGRRGRPRLALTVSVAAMLATTAPSIPLIGEYWKTGAAAASSVGYLVGAVLAWVFFARLARR